MNNELLLSGGRYWEEGAGVGADRRERAREEKEKDS